jgi:hypothetical protein
MSTPYHELYRIAEEAHKTASERYVRELCDDAASEYGDLASEIYRAARNVYNREFA